MHTQQQSQILCSCVNHGLSGYQQHESMLFTQCGQTIMALTNRFNKTNILTPPTFGFEWKEMSREIWFIETIFIAMNNLWYQLGLSDTAILVSQSILKPIFMILNSSQQLQISQS